MPTFDELFDALAAEEIQGLEDAGSGEGFINSLLGIGGDLFTGAIDLLDRPGRAVRQLIAGDPGQALSAIATPFLPEFAEEALGIEESEPLFFSDLLEEAGVPEFDVGLPLGITGRNVAGFFADVISDPLTLGLGGALSKGLQAGAKAGGSKLLSGLEKLSVRGGLSGALADATIGVGTKFSKRLSLRSVEGAEEFLEKAALKEGRIRGKLAVADREMRELGKSLKGLDDAGRQQFLRVVLDPDVDVLLKQEGLLGDIAGAPDLSRRAAGKSVAEQKRGLRALQQQWDQMTPALKNAAAIWQRGDPTVLAKFGSNLGKLQREAGKLGRDILQEEKMLDLVRRNDIRHVTLKVNDVMLRDPERLAGELVNDLATRMGQGGAHGANLTPAGRNSMISAAKKGTDQKARKTALMLEELDESFGVFRKDPKELFALESYNYATVTENTDFLRAMLNDARWAKPSVLQKVGKGVSEIADPGWELMDASRFPKWLQDAIPRTSKKAKGFQVPQALAREIDGVVKKVRMDPDGEAVSRAVRAMTRGFQGWTLALYPATWLRNLVGNFQNNYLAGAGHSPIDIADATKILMGPKATGGTIRLGPKSVVGETIEHGQFMAHSLDQSVHMGGFHGTDFTDSMAQLTMGGKTRSATQKLLDPNLNPLTRGGYWMMNMGDNIPRASHFLAKLRQGATFEEAGRSVRKFLYAGEQLTDFEKGIRNLIPFYGFTKFNIPRSFKFFMEQPQKIAQWGRIKVKLDRDHRIEIPDEVKPEFFQSQVALPVGRDKDGNPKMWFANSWIPLTMMNELGTPKQFVEFVANSLTPFLKVPFETVFNYNTFYKQVIEKYPGETETFLGGQISRKDAQALRSFRMLSEIDRAFFPRSSAIRANQEITEEVTRSMRQAFSRIAFGRPPTGFDFQRQKRIMLSKYKRTIGQIKFAIKRAAEQGDQSRVESLDAQLRHWEQKRGILQGRQLEREPQFLSEMD